MPRKRPLAHGGTIAARLRSGYGFELLSPFNYKTPLGEKAGYLTAILYLAPHDMAKGKSVCPHSTPACREGCLFSAGRGKTPRVVQARLRRTMLYLHRRQEFLERLAAELAKMQKIADGNGLKLAIRLNGTSDILFERERLRDGSTLFDRFPRATFYDYTRTPMHHRKVPENWRLVFSLADWPLGIAVQHLLAGYSVAVIVPEAEKGVHKSKMTIDDGFLNQEITLIDGDLDDLRFLDPAPSLVMLKPKGRLTRGGPMVHHNFLADLEKHYG